MKSVMQTKSIILRTTNKKTLRTCKNGHQYYKSSDCPTCPACEEKKRPKEGFLSLLYAPARRALENNNIKTLKQLSKYSESDILKLHGIGKTAIPLLKRELEKTGLTFKERRRKTAASIVYKTLGVRYLCKVSAQHQCLCGWIETKPEPKACLTGQFPTFHTFNRYLQTGDSVCAE
jgi:hypothetical protein